MPAPCILAALAEPAEVLRYGFAVLFGNRLAGDGADLVAALILLDLPPYLQLELFEQ